MHTAHTDRMDIPNGHLAYRDTGTGRPVVLLHGGALDHRMWDRQLDTLRAGHRAIAVDARGHGDSSTPTAPFRHCDDLAVLLEQLEVAPATLVGLSMGASTALDVALEHPDLVRAVVISGAGTSEPDFRDPWVLDMFATWERTARAGDAAGWIEAFLRMVPGPYRSPADVDPAVVAACREMAERTIATHVAPDPSGAPVPPVPPTAPSDTWARLCTIAVPVLGIVGDLDADDHIRMVRRVTESVPDGRFATVAGTAHYPNMERAEQFDDLLLSFLEETAAGQDVSCGSTPQRSKADGWND